MVRLHKAMKEKLKTAYYSEKIHILTLVPDKWSRNYSSEYLNLSIYLVRTTWELKKVGSILPIPAPKKGKPITNETLHLVTSFYDDDDYSRQICLERKAILV